MDYLDLNQGALAPVTDECICNNLSVEGEIPRDLNGMLVRNGPNPFSGKFSGQGVLSWWPEAAMLHAIKFADGNVLEYRNKWVRTRKWADFFDARQTPLLLDTNPNVNVISHGDTLLALAEGGPPVVVDAALETSGQWTAQTEFTRGMTAHPKIDPVTKELITFHAHWSEPFLRYGVIDAKGVEIVNMEIDIPAPAMMHDMAVTETYSILLDLGVGYDFSLLKKGYRIPVCWQDARVSRLGIVPRHGGEVSWLEITPCFIQHVVNAYDAEAEVIVLDAVRYPWYFKIDPQTREFTPDPLGELWRYTINLQQRTVHEEQLIESNIELPRINELHTGRYNRYSYAVEQPTATEMRGIIRYDALTTTMQRHSIDAGDNNSEPIFVPDCNGTAEDDGWLLVSVYRQATDSNEIRILDARNISGKALATISLGRRIPAGFHGAWIAMGEETGWGH